VRLPPTGVAPERDDGLVVNHLPDGGSLAVEERRVARDVHLLVERAGFEREVETRDLLDVQDDARLDDRLEAVAAHGDLVAARLQERDGVIALVVGDRLALEAVRLVDERDLRAGDDRAVTEHAKQKRYKNIPEMRFSLWWARQPRSAAGTNALPAPAMAGA
jgi:hypothetical protein